MDAQWISSSLRQHQQGSSFLPISKRSASSCSASSWKRSVKERIKPAALLSYSTSSTVSPGNDTQVERRVYFLRTTTQQAQVNIRTVDSGVGLDKHLTSFLPKQYRLPQTQEVVSAAVADGGVAVVESSASFHIRRRLEHLRNGGIR